MPNHDTHPSSVLYKAILGQQDSQQTAAMYLAATLDGEFRGQDVVIEGTLRVAATVRDRATGAILGEAEHGIYLPVAQEHQPPTDTDVLEVSPGSGEQHPEAVVG